jgi:hypothetical protein
MRVDNQLDLGRHCKIRSRVARVDLPRKTHGFIQIDSNGRQFLVMRTLCELIQVTSETL